LNEGFASFVGEQAVAHIFPDWDVWTQFISDVKQQHLLLHTHTHTHTVFPICCTSQVHNNALDVDSLENSHPIEIDVKTPEQISEIFDTISYYKGASVSVYEVLVCIAPYGHL
jgi:aminopeptidase N